MLDSLKIRFLKEQQTWIRVSKVKKLRNHAFFHNWSYRTSESSYYLQINHISAHPTVYRADEGWTIHISSHSTVYRADEGWKIHISAHPNVYRADEGWKIHNSSHSTVYRADEGWTFFVLSTHHYSGFIGILISYMEYCITTYSTDIW